MVNPNYTLNANNNNNNNLGQDLFKVRKKSSHTINVLNVEKEQKDKENNETNEKIKVSENITITNAEGQGI